MSNNISTLRYQEAYRKVEQVEKIRDFTNQCKEDKVSSECLLKIVNGINKQAEKGENFYEHISSIKWDNIQEKWFIPILEENVFKILLDKGYKIFFNLNNNYEIKISNRNNTDLTYLNQQLNLVFNNPTKINGSNFEKVICLTIFWGK